MEEMTEQEALYILRKCYVMTTNHCLDEENIKLKQAIKKILKINKKRNQRNNELRKKNKQLKAKLDEMIEEYEYNARINVNNFCDEEIRKDKCIQDCKSCIKQYFERKAENI